jgi:imidazolonepropionase-like amidohydrolase
MNAPRTVTCARLAAVLVAWCAVALPAAASPPSPEPPAGLRETTPSSHAFTNARLVIAPGRIVEHGTLVVKDGVIVAAGTGVKAPPGAVVHDLAGATVYPGFIDAFVELPSTPAPAGSAGRGAPYWNPFVTPERRIEREIAQSDSATARGLRDQGVTDVLALPAGPVMPGMGAVISTADVEVKEALVRPLVALRVALRPARSGGGEGDFNVYPSSRMGALTLTRQAFYDADWYAKAEAAIAKDPKLVGPETSDALAALAAFRTSGAPTIVEADDVEDALRADRLGKEFAAPVIVRASGQEFRQLDAVKASGRALVVPVRFPRPPIVDTPEQAQNVSLEELMTWDIAPENPARLAKAGVKFALTSDGLDNRRTFLGQVRYAVERGLDADAALAALTTVPAAMLGVSDRLGTLEPGKLAHFVITDGEMFKRRGLIREVWIGEKQYSQLQDAAVDARGKWKLAFSPPLVGRDSTTLDLTGQPDTLSGTMELPKKNKLRALSILGRRLSLAVPTDSLGAPGFARFSAEIDGDAMTGWGEAPDGSRAAFTGRRVAGAVADTATVKLPGPASFAVDYPLGEFGRAGVPEQPAAVAFTHATVWTEGPQGTLQNATVLVEKGKIAAVGTDVKLPSGAIVVDATGKHVTPGLIDCHSHSGTDGGVNEGGQTITAEVRIGDYIAPDDIAIYRELAGGLTAAHVLHGSANTIGGQCQLIKLRWGASAEAMKFEGYTPTIKFALGENVKQSNRSQPTTRYPQTRMGVEQLLRDAFQRAKEYDASWTAWKKGGKGLPPRRDLELDALAEILRGERIIHCHSYRQDEILSLMRVCEDYGIHVGTFQHILEGYKVADTMAKHGAGGSTFSDWWAYKVEVQDAIPWNGALMDRAGVVVSFNSDSNELARRLNTEAGKAVKYGGLAPERALAFVTINPAKQLHVEKRVGSLEPGKDADLVVWSAAPLTTAAVCEQTWIDGRRYFDRTEDARMREDAQKMRTALVQKALAAPDRGGGRGGAARGFLGAFGASDEEGDGDGHGTSCHEEEER